MKTVKGSFKNSNSVKRTNKAEIEFNVMEEMYVASYMHTCAEKTTF